ncbi:MAG: hypothetical protein VX294_09755 [Candidatus Latescibacterota bacterium]|nr:hypothetical protein [Candidatus Latescibacterota bacterium]
MPTYMLNFIFALLIMFGGCSLLPPRQHLVYRVDVDPVLSSGKQETFYEDPSDSTFVWSKEGLIVKVKFYDDQMLDKRFDPKVSPYTLSGWVDPIKGYTPPLWTAFEVTVINRTRERVELDPTQAVLRMDNGEYYFCRQGVGRLISKDHYFDYSYLKWSGREGNVEFYKNTDMNDIWHRTEYRREKPVRKGRKYTGMLTFPPLPEGVSEFTLEFNDFILAYDSAEAGFGNPTEFMDIHFDFNVDQGVYTVGDK